MPLTFSIVTQEREVLRRDDVLRLIVPTTEGQITVLPSHAALMASLEIGELIAVVPGEEHAFAIHGGFMQVTNDEVTVLADAAEHIDEIDAERADEARARGAAALGDGQRRELRPAAGTALAATGAAAPADRPPWRAQRDALRTLVAPMRRRVS